MDVPLEEEKCHWCRGAGFKMNRNGDTWSCRPCQWTGLAKFYIEGARKFAGTGLGIDMIWSAGLPATESFRPPEPPPPPPAQRPSMRERVARWLSSGRILR